MESPETYTATEAGKVLGISRRQVLNLIHAGDLEAEREADGEPWKIPKRSAHALKDLRPPRERRPRSTETATEAAERAAEYLERVMALERELGRTEGRLELEATARSTLEDQLRHERERSDRLEAELREARRPWWRRLTGS